MQKIKKQILIPIRLFSSVIVIVMSLQGVANSEELAAPEYNVKAAFLYNFAKFITWPHDAFANSEALFTICVLGDNPFGSALKSIEKKNVRERKITVKLCKSAELAKKCHILFISSSEKNKISEIVSVLQGLPVLTVSDIDKSIHSGVMIELFKVRENIKFSVNLKAAVNSHIEISSKLLHLAQTIIKSYKKIKVYSRYARIKQPYQYNKIK